MSSNGSVTAPFCSGIEGAGCYALGAFKFYTRRIQLANILFRQEVAGEYDNLLVGLLCVFIVATVSDIVYTTLLRSRGLKATPLFAIQAASLLDEVTHFQHLLSYCSLIAYRTKSNCEHVGFTSLSRRSSISILAAAMGIFCVEVAVIYASQPKRIVSEKQYHLRGVHPVRRASDSGEHPLLSPTAQKSIFPDIIDHDGTRKFTVTSMIRRSISILEASGNPQGTGSSGIEFTESVNVTSWYHRGGSDHFLEFFSYGMYKSTFVSGRMRLNLKKRGLAVLFDNIDDRMGTMARSLQKEFVKTAVNISCKSLSDVSPKKCVERMQGVQETALPDVSTYTFIYSLPASDLIGEVDVMAPVIGHRTHFKAHVINPMRFLLTDVGLLVGGSVIFEEERKPGLYVDLRTNDPVYDVPGLLIEEARHGGVVLLSMCFSLSLVFAVLLRHFLKPISPRQLALSALFEGPEINGQESKLDGEGSI